MPGGKRKRNRRRIGAGKQPQAAGAKQPNAPEKPATRPLTRPNRHFANYANRLNRSGLRFRFYKKIHAQLSRRVPKAAATINRKAVKHIWARHGCYQNAKRQEKLRKNRGKMPSYFRNHRALVRSVSETLVSPNWTRTAVMHRGKGWKCRRPHLGVPLHKSPYTRAHPIRLFKQRTFYFKRFKEHIGYSGRGYGCRGAFASEDEECFCCAVLLEGKRLITAFPILTVDADRHGGGPKTVVSDVVDRSTFDSRSEISSSVSVEEADSLATARDLTLAEASAAPDQQVTHAGNGNVVANADGMNGVRVPEDHSAENDNQRLPAAANGQKEPKSDEQKPMTPHDNDEKEDENGTDPDDSNSNV